MIAAFCFSACSSSDDDNNSINPLGITKRLSKVTRSYGIDNNKVFQEFIYDSQGRIIQTKEGNPTDDQKNVVNTYVYDNNSITRTHYYSKDISWQYIYTLENGRIAKVYNGDSQITTTFIYDNGYLTKETESKGREYNYIWSDGNLMEVYDGNRILHTYEYTDITAPQGFFPMGHNSIQCYGMSSYLGKTSKYLPSKYTEGQGVLIEYEWTIKDGLPIKMIQNIKKAPTTGIYTYTFEWN